MIKAVQNWWNQRSIRKFTEDLPTYSQVLFDYNHGKWEQMISGPDTDRVTTQVEAHVGELISAGRERVLVLILHATHEAGYVMAMNHKKAHHVVWFRSGVYDMAEAMADISDWCKGAY